MKTGTVYSDTIIHSAPERFAADAPYQLILVTLDAGGRQTARVEGGHVTIGDRVAFAEERGGIPFYRKID